MRKERLVKLAQIILDGHSHNVPPQLVALMLQTEGVTNEEAAEIKAYLETHLNIEQGTLDA